MKALFTILKVLAVIVGLLLIVGLFVKKEYSVQRDITIAKPNAEVFDYIRHLKNQSQYSKWVMMDPNAKMDFRGEDGTVGFVSAWDSQMKEVGKGEQEIKAITGTKMDLEIRFYRPFESVASASMESAAVDSSTSKVSWSFHGNMNYPMNVMLLFMNMDKMLGDDISTGLTNMKAVLEKQ